MIIRKATESDIQSIYNIATQEGWKTFSIAKITQLLSKSHMIVIEIDDEIIGYTRYLTDEIVTLYIAEIVILNNHRNNGYAKELIQYLQDLYPSTRIELLSENNAFYEKMKFRNIGTGYRLP
ncbi:GNAT family N-acetyltransferase [Mammaliicoccus sp. Dog046]|uniref:GNAT family N-acetyltransferase n=1 Tax=Mammaliicoccus sp. Dog046 TaxID=3034233 RepID=UPI002B262262|nr:GNAT family N-acetyltransferase [Mammaliicoccus sp. Dog046]WQK85359.1 GNAT family N-acetyltransferase [Mammaliicoccus sp. Dog046]